MNSNAMGGNSAVDNLVTELSPELAGIIGQPPSVEEGSPPPKVPGYTAPERDSAKKAATEAVRDSRSTSLTRKFGAIAAAIGNPDRVRVWKRQPNGVMAFVEEYRWRDIQHTGDLEVFLSQYVKPMPPPAGGPGEYPIRIIDAMGKEYDAGSIHLIGPSPSAQPQNDIAMMVRELREALRPAPAPDPLEAMERAQAFAERLKGKSGDPVTMMMMMRAMEPPKDDSRILSALEKIVARIEKLETAPMPMPMPMLPPAAPQPSLVEIVAAVTTGLKAVIDVTRPPPVQGPAPVDPFTMAKMLSDASKEGAAAAEKQADRLINMLENRDRREQPVASLTDEMEKMKTLHEFVKSFTPQQQQPQGNTGTNFWDAILAFANNEKFAGNIGEAIRERAKQPPGQVQITSNKPVPPKQIPQQAQPPQQQPRPQTAPPPFVPAGQPAPTAAPTPQPEVVSAAEAAPPPQPAEPVVPRIFVPETFRPFCAKLDEACSTLVDGKPDDGTIATRTIEGLMELFKLAQWRPTVETLLGAIDQDHKDQAMHILGNILSLLARNEWLHRESAMNSLRVLRDQWDIVRMGVQELLKTAPILVSPPAAVAPPSDPEAPAAPPAPADVPDEVLHEITGDEQEETPPPG